MCVKVVNENTMIVPFIVLYVDIKICSYFYSLLEHSHQWLGCVLHISVLTLSEDRSDVPSTDVEQIKVSVGGCIL